MAKKVILGKVDLSGVSADFAWYTVITLFNNEEKYVENVQNAVRGTEFEQLIAEYFVPMRYGRVMSKTADGKERVRVSRVKGCYSTYVFIKAKMTPDLWNFLRAIPGIAVVLSTGGQPVALANEEVESIRWDCTPSGYGPAELAELEQQLRERYVMIDTNGHVELPLEVGKRVEVTNGVCSGLTGIVRGLTPGNVNVEFEGFDLTLSPDDLRPAGANLVV